MLMTDDDVSARIAEDEEIERLGRNPWMRLAAVVLTALITAGVGFVLLNLMAPDTGRDDTRRVEFTDKAGRVCTQVQVGPAVAIDCDYKPAESRLGGLIDDLGDGQ